MGIFVFLFSYDTIESHRAAHFNCNSYLLIHVKQQTSSWVF